MLSPIHLQQHLMQWLSAQLHHRMVHLHTIHVRQIDLLHPLLEDLQTRPVATDRHCCGRDGGDGHLLGFHIGEPHCVDAPAGNHVGGEPGQLPPL